MKYTWGYIKEATLAKMDMTMEDANAQHFINKMHIYANEALTQICSAIKPKHSYAKFEVFRKHDAWIKCVREFGIYNEHDIIPKPVFINDTEKLFWNKYETLIKTIDIVKMPNDFIVFNDDAPEVNTGKGDPFEADDTYFRYVGDNQLMFYKPGVYTIAYSARWFFFTSSTDNDVELDIPLDICDALPSYIASQLFKIDDEVKSQIYRNEYEMFLSRINDTNYKKTQTLKIGGGW